MDRIEKLRAKLADCQAKAEAIQAAAVAADRDLTEQEAKDIKAHVQAFKDAKAQLDAALEIQNMGAELDASPGRQIPPSQPQNTRVDSTEDVNNTPVTRTPAQPRDTEAEARHGFAHFGEFANAVRLANPSSAQSFHVDSRLDAFNAPTTVGQEGVGADGGFAVPPDFRSTIMSFYDNEESVFARTDRATTSGNSYCAPTDETTPWQTSGGVQAYWEGENDQLALSKPALKDNTLRLNKLTALVPVTNELLEDAPAMANFVPRKAGQKMAFKSDLAVIQGTGAGQPLGLLNSPALISVAKVASQEADTIVGVNITDMYSRMYAPWRRNAVWLINQDIEPQLYHLQKVGKLDTGANDTGWGVTVPFYDPVTDTLMGRPVIRTQACETLGDQGDIIFANLDLYLSVTKTAGIRQDVSMHLWFDYDTMAFRFIFRQAGQPWVSSTVAARDGSTTYSPFVTLAARA